MSDFLRFIDDLRRRLPIHVEIYYSKTMDWCIKIWRKGLAEEYPNSDREGSDAIVCSVGSSDIELCFAMAHVAVKEWLLNNDGGY